MDWIYEGTAAAFWQLTILATCVIIAAAAMWSCSYLGISPGYGILAFYTAILLFINLLFSWKKSRDSRPVEIKVEE
jgi:hypothetical protein